MILAVDYLLHLNDNIILKIIKLVLAIKKEREERERKKSIATSLSWFLFSMLITPKNHVQSDLKQRCYHLEISINIIIYIEKSSTKSISNIFLFIIPFYENEN